MNQFQHHAYFRLWLVRMGVMLFWLAALTLPLSVLAGTGSTGTNWISTKELVKKWAGTPLADIEAAAAKEDAMAQHYLGYCNAEGIRMPVNPKAAVHWYQRALRNGYLPSANNLGLLYQRGLLVTNDLGKAIYFYTYAAERGLDRAQINLGIVYRDGLGVAFNPEESAKWFELAIANDSALGRFNMALLYEKEGNAENAFRLMDQAAAQGLTDAMAKLYYYYWDGIGVAQDHDKARQWAAKGAEAGNAWAQCIMGYICENPEYIEGKPHEQLLPDLVQMAHWYRLSAEQNWVAGQYHLGLCYLNGLGVMQDSERGLELMRAAADGGIDDAQTKLAELYSWGIGEPRGEHDRPVALLKRARAWRDLIFRHENGIGTERNLVMAVQYYIRAAKENKRGYSLADKLEFRLPKRYIGYSQDHPPGEWIIIDVPGDTIENADQTYNETSNGTLKILAVYLNAAKGDAATALQIGDMYDSGRDVPMDVAQAWLWYTLAQQDGSPAAPKKIAGVVARLSAGELKAAQQKLPDLIKELATAATAIPSSP